MKNLYLLTLTLIISSCSFFSKNVDRIPSSKMDAIESVKILQDIKLNNVESYRLSNNCFIKNNLAYVDQSEVGTSFVYKISSEKMEAELRENAIELNSGTEFKTFKMYNDRNRRFKRYPFLEEGKIDPLNPDVFHNEVTFLVPLHLDEKFQKLKMKEVNLMLTIECISEKIKYPLFESKSGYRNKIKDKYFEDVNANLSKKFEFDGNTLFLQN